MGSFLEWQGVVEIIRFSFFSFLIAFFLQKLSFYKPLSSHIASHIFCQDNLCGSCKANWAGETTHITQKLQSFKIFKHSFAKEIQKCPELAGLH